MAVDLLDQLPIGRARHPARARVASTRASDRDAASTFRGLVLVTGAALGLVWGLMRGNSAGWSSLEVAAALGGGDPAGRRLRRLGAARRASRWCRCGSSAPRAFCSRQSRRASSCMPSMYGVLFFLPQFLQTAQGHGPLGAGVRLLPWTATLFVVAPFAGELVNRDRRDGHWSSAGSSCRRSDLAWIALIAAPDLAYVQLVAPLILAGAGVSMAMPAAQNAVLNAVAGSEIGKASGTFNMLRYLGGVFGIAVLVAVFAHTGNFHSVQAFSEAFAVAMGAAASLSVVAAIAGLWLPRTAIGRSSIAAVAKA